MFCIFSLTGEPGLSLVGKPGPKGNQGLTGPKGERGIPGERGLDGLTGSIGKLT